MRLGDWVSAMRALGLQATLDDLRDIAWLADRLGAAQANAGPRPGAPPPGTGPTPAPASPPPAPRATPAPTPPGAGLPGPAAAGLDSAPALYAAAPGSGELRARRVQLRGAPALPQGLAIARALRPLSRRRPGRQLVLDERATAEFIADTGVHAPVWRPARERWFDIVLAVEDVPALAAWQPVLAAFEQLLRRQGGFRSVLRWQLRAQGGQLQARGPGGRPCSPRALHDRDGRRLLLVLSDCTSEAWHRGAMGAWLQRAAAEVPVAVAQLLPPVLWPNTAVGFAELRTRAPRIAAPAVRLQVQRPGWAAGEPGLVLPVLALEPAAVSAWARMVAAAGDAWAQAALLPLPEDGADSNTPSQTPAPAPDADARVAAFRASATLDAQRLAAYFSVVRPLTPPVMRVIHQALAPASGAAALAQVFVAGVLQPPQAGSAPDHTVHDFHPGVRERLQGGLTKAEFLRVNLALHEFLQEQAGTAFDFFALLEDRAGTERLPEQAQPFVQMARSAARRFGAGTAAAGAAAAEGAAQGRSGVLAEIRITMRGERLHFQHHSARGDSNVYQTLPEGVHALLRRVLQEPGESLNELRRAVMPLGLQDGNAYAEGPPWAELVLDEETEAFPWELLFRSVHEDRTPLALQRGLTRRPRQAAPVRAPRGPHALAATPDDLAYGAYGPLALEVRETAATLERCLPGKVTTLMRVAPRQLLAALAKPTLLRVLHLAAAGEVQREPDSEDGPRVRALLDERQPLTLADLALRLGTPELVFLSVDHAAAVAPRLLQAGAAVVVAPTGTVHPDAAAVFADSFYRVLANGQTLLEATHQARATCHQRLPDSDAWGRFQVWGDPAWRLVDEVVQAAPPAEPPPPAEPLPLPRLEACEHSVYISHSPADDSVWFDWASHFGRELERGLSARLRGVRLPPVRMAGGPFAPGVPIDEQLRQGLERCFALVVLVHDHYLQSEWCLREVQQFHALYGEAGLRERLYVVAMSAPAMRELANNPAWRRLLGDKVWLPFHDPLQPARPLDIYVAQELVSQAFQQALEPLRDDLLAKLRAASATPPETAGSVRIYIESNRVERTLWEPLGDLLRQRWTLLLESLQHTDAPAPTLRARGLPIENLDQMPLDDADGIVLLWGRKTADALVAHINQVENKLAPGRQAPPGIVAYLSPPQQATEPVPAWGWQVLRFEVRDDGVEPVAEERAEVDRFLLKVLQRHYRLRGLPMPEPIRVPPVPLRVALICSPDLLEDRQAVVAAVQAAASGFEQQSHVVALREVATEGDTLGEGDAQVIRNAELVLAVLGRGTSQALTAALAQAQAQQRVAGQPSVAMWQRLPSDRVAANNAELHPMLDQDRLYQTYADAEELSRSVLALLLKHLDRPAAEASPR